MVTLRKYDWMVASASVRGASHERSGVANQDAISHLPAPNIPNKGLCAATAVSDGHGSPKCIRSEMGSRLAVESALSCVSRFFDGTEARDNRRFESDFPSMLVAEWRDKVSKHVRESPFTEAEHAKLNESAGVAAAMALREAAAQADGAALHLAYGATILLVVVTDCGIFYLQLGDGDIMAVSAAGDVEFPIPEDPSLMANETTSLCMRDAVHEFRFGFHHMEKEPPALILVSTDGYGNAFASTPDFHKVGTDVLRMIRDSGMPQKEEIESWLDVASRQGSGDDATLGILCRADMVGLMRPPTPISAATPADTPPQDSVSAPTKLEVDVAPISEAP
jgi:hypothetical protein